jgi:Rrf2 family protein
VSTSARLDYGLRALVLLARADGPVKADTLAADGAMPFRFLGQVLADLRRGELVRSRRGGQGGYWLARPAQDITVADVIRAVEGAGTSNADNGPLGGVWATVQAGRIDAASSITLVDLVEADDTQLSAGA